jgi:general nucleoside transport system permease protein
VTVLVADVRERPARSAGIVGVGLGLLALWSALPPFSITWRGLPLVLGLGGLAAGVWSLREGGDRKLAIWAILTALAGTLTALWAQGVDRQSLDNVVNAGLVAATLRFATPLAFAALGGIFSERSGVVNIGLEGMMLTGAFFGVWGSAASGSWVIGLLVAMAAGGVLAAVHAVASIHLRADQIVSGTAVNFIGLGVTGYLYREVYGDQGTPADLSRVPDVHLPVIEDIPFFGDVFGQLNLLIWILLGLLVVAHLALFRTPIGLRLRAVGEHPRAADTVGISVYAVRYAAVILSGMLAALGGAYITVGFVGSFSENITAGAGFIALAAVIFGKWRPYGAFGACLLFGFSNGLAQRLQSEADISANLLSTLPYILALIALVGLIGRSRPPAAVGRPYVKD